MSTVITNLTDSQIKVLGAAVSFTSAGISLLAAAKAYDVTSTLLIRGLILTGTIEVA